MSRLRVLVLASYPDRAACTRFRVVEYGQALAEQGIDLELCTALDDDAFTRFYVSSSRLEKGTNILKGAFRQLGALSERDVDVVLVQREATLVGPVFMEWIAARFRGLPLVYDLDDAVWDMNTTFSQHPLAARLLKFPGKTWSILRMAEHVVAGSEYLGSEVSARNPAVTVLPTVVSRNKWQPLPGRLDGAFVSVSRPPVIGWIGTQAAAHTLETAAPALRRLRESGRDFVLRVIGAAKDFRLPGLEMDVVPWRREREIADFQDLDIGIAPLLPIEYSKGKCGFKLLQYMAVGVPSVASPKGGVVDFVRHGENALFAETDDEWVRALESLLDDQALRARIARTGRTLVEGSYSIEAQAPRLAEILRNAAGAQRRQRRSPFSTNWAKNGSGSSREATS
jgi:glycosyltransferase involved in cell wall biosynthesis